MNVYQTDGAIDEIRTKHLRASADKGLGAAALSVGVAKNALSGADNILNNVLHGAKQTVILWDEERTLVDVQNMEKGEISYGELALESNSGADTEGELVVQRVVLDAASVERVLVRLVLVLPSPPETIEIGVVEEEDRV